MFEIMLNLNNDNKEPLYMQIYKHIKDEILCGSIPSDSKLPSIRNLCKDLKVSKNTVEAAYEQLIAEGYVKSKNRSGLYVENIESSLSNAKNLSSSLYKEKISDNSHSNIKYDFSSGQIDLSAFPYNQFRKTLTRCVDEYSKELLLYGDHKGDYGLRSEIAKYIHHSRGVRCSPEQILISSGTQESLNLLCLILLNLYSSIAFENPSYIGAKDVFRHFNFNINPINLNEDGVDIDTLSKTNSKIVYVTPSHQYPYGMVMPISKRLKLLNWANKNNGIIIEDDYDGEFRYKGKSIPSLQGLDETGRVVYLGSFSKSLMPSLRISYLVLPKFLLNIYEEKYRTYEQPVPRLMQKTLELFMKEGYWDKHLRKSKVLYKKKQEVLINSLTKHFGEQVNIIGADSGLHILIQVKTELKEDELINKALKAGIKVHPTLINWIKPPDDLLPVIFIGFAGVQIEHISDAMETLKKCWFNTK